MNNYTIDKSRIVVVIPSFNEGNRVEKVVREVKLHGFHRIIVVDDNSGDNSMIKLHQHGVIILHHLINRGAGAATETGLNYCRELPDFDAVITIDADAQHDPADIEHLLKEHFTQEADLTIGNRFIKDAQLIPAAKRFFNGIANLTTTILCGHKVSDSQSGFKAFSNTALEKIYIEHDKYEYCTEIFIKAYRHKLKVINVPVKSYYPDEIKNKGQNIFHGINTFINLVYSAMFKNN